MKQGGGETNNLHIFNSLNMATLRPLILTVMFAVALLQWHLINKQTA